VFKIRLSNSKDSKNRVRNEEITGSFQGKNIKKMAVKIGSGERDKKTSRCEKTRGEMGVDECAS
jgi:hypothetical protein